MVRCPYCGHRGDFERLKEWRFRFYRVEMLLCPECGKRFNHYKGTSPRTGKVTGFVIRLGRKERR